MRTKANEKDFVKFVVVVGGIYFLSRFLASRLNGTGFNNSGYPVVAGVRG